MSLSQEYGDNFVPVIPSLDPQRHTPVYPFCFGDRSCPCHEDTEEVNKVNEHYNNGLMTSEEATKFVKGDLS
jgi:hypothetical protein